MSHIRDRLIQLKNEVENTGNGAYFSKNNISKILEEQIKMRKEMKEYKKKHTFIEELLSVYHFHKMWK